MSIIQKVKYVESKVIMVTNENKNAVIRTASYDKAKSDRIKQLHVEDYFVKPQAFVREEEFRFVFIPRVQIGKDAIFFRNKSLVGYCGFEK